MKFVEFASGDKLFMSPEVEDHCRDVVQAMTEIAELRPVEYPKPPELFLYPEPHLLKLESLISGLRRAVQEETQSTAFGFPRDLVRRLFKRLGI